MALLTSPICKGRDTPSSKDRRTSHTAVHDPMPIWQIYMAFGMAQVGSYESKTNVEPHAWNPRPRRTRRGAYRLAAHESRVRTGHTRNPARHVRTGSGGRRTGAGHGGDRDRRRLGGAAIRAPKPAPS